MLHLLLRILHTTLRTMANSVSFREATVSHTAQVGPGFTMVANFSQGNKFDAAAKAQNDGLGVSVQ
jgi:hypothetical protein